MSLLLFLKPHYRSTKGGFNAVYMRGGRKKKKTYVITNESGEIIAQPTDFRLFAKEMIGQRLKRRKKTNEEIAILLFWEDN